MLNGLESDNQYLQFIKQQFCMWQNEDWDEALSADVAERGYILSLRFLLEHNCPYDASALVGAIRGNHFECFVYLYNDMDWRTWYGEIDRQAIAYRRLDML